MAQHVSFFNWSLKTLLLTEPNSFNKAKIRILFTILIFALIKLLIALPTAYHQGQDFQFIRALVLLLLDLFLLKLLLFNKKYLRAIAHIMIASALFIIWSNVFISVQTVNIVTLQFVFMVILSSFYLLEKGFGLFYSIASISPIIIYLLSGREMLPLNILPSELASPGYEIIVILNFITLVVSHYLYLQAFSSTIDEKETLNNQLQVAVKEANQAAQSKSDFLSTMSHELRTPLNSVIGMTELLLDDSYNDEQAENLKILNFSAVSLHSLINDILDFNKLDSDKLTLEAVSVNLHSLVNNICAGLRFQANEKGLDLVVDIDEALKEQRIITDPTRITQIIYNLAGNAIKFTSVGNVSVRVEVTGRNDDFINTRFSIIDTGIGISTDKQGDIFEPFIQASTSTTREYGGTGLGLAIVKRLLALFNSSISLDSVPGSGSAFFFELSFPLDKLPANENSTDAEPVYDLAGLRVLIAEDNPINRILLKKVFSKWKNEPIFAQNGEEALEKLSLNTYDVILMDIHMPVMDGYETSRRIRSMQDTAFQRIHIIALTASVSNNLSEKIKEAGMDDYICKPFNSKELYGKLKNRAIKNLHML